MDFLPSMDKLKEESKEAVETAEQEHAERERALEEKARQQELIAKISREFYQKMSEVASPEECYIDMPSKVWKINAEQGLLPREGFFRNSRISGHIFSHEYEAGNEYTWKTIDHYLITEDGVCWTVSKSPEYGSKVHEFFRTNMTPEHWSQALTKYMKSYMDQRAIKLGIDE